MVVTGQRTAQCPRGLRTDTAMAVKESEAFVPWKAFLCFPRSPLFKAAAKVVENKRARTAVSEDKPNGDDPEEEAEAAWGGGQRFVSSRVRVVSRGRVSVPEQR